ncbi:MAG TPA: LamG domain-containing protein [Myxococcaceae bacterium]|nr:LamG domain-containing protein [Myxococcaceae bacterium]
MPRSFAITTSEPSLQLSPAGRAELTFTVSNTLGQPVRVRTVVEPEGQASRDWFTLVGDAERDLAPDGTQSYSVKLSVPPGTPEGQHAFHLLVANVANPDEQFAIGPSVAFQVQRAAPAARKPFPWWIVAVAAGVLLIAVGAITIARVLRDDGPGHGGSGSEPTVFLTFDGTRSFVDLGEAPALSFTGTVTMEAWIRPRSIDGLRNILAHGYTANPPGELLLRISNGQYQAGSWNGSNFVVSAPIPREDIGSWVHLAGVYDGTSWRLYRNGQELASLPSTVGVLPVSEAWSIGARGGVQERYFHGDIAQVNLWRVPRTPEQIREDMQRAPKGDEQGLAGSWSLSEGRGTLARDSTRGESHGLVRGATWPSEAVTGAEPPVPQPPVPQPPVPQPPVVVTPPVRPRPPVVVRPPPRVVITPAEGRLEGPVVRDHRREPGTPPRVQVR